MTKILVDPLDHHILCGLHTEESILERCTVLNHWVNTCPATISIMECFKARYHFGWYPWDTGRYEIDESGVYSSYLDKEKVVPLLMYHREDEEVFVYEYDLVAFRGEYGTIVCRLD